MKISFDNFVSKYVTEEWIVYLKNYTSSHFVPKNTVIISEGESVKGVYFILSGKIKVVTGLDSKHERLLRLSKDGDLLGHRGISSSGYPVSAITLTDSELMFVPIRIFDKLVRGNPDFAFFVIDFLAEDLKNTEEHLKSLIHNDVLVRISLILCMLIDAFGYDETTPKKLSFTLSRANIASFAGTTYESVIRNLAKLEEMKIIKLENKDIYILKEKEIRKIDPLL